MDAKEVRYKIHEMIMQRTRNIDSLFCDKVEDFVLIEEMPIGIKVGKCTIYVGNLTIDNNYKFFEIYYKILANIGAKNLNFDLLANGKDLYKAILTHKRLYKDLKVLIKKTVLRQQAYYLDSVDKATRKEIKWVNCSWRYFKKNITTEKLIEICWLVYLYNFDAEKKNLSLILGIMHQEQLMETYMYSWLRSLGGISGKFQLAHLINTEHWSDDSQKIEIPMDKKGLEILKGSKNNGNR